MDLSGFLCTYSYVIFTIALSRMNEEAIKIGVKE